MTMRSIIPAGFVLVAVLSTAPAYGAVCQGESMTLDEAVEVINRAPTCNASRKIFEDCSLGTSGDIRLGDAVQAKCEANFLANLKPPQKRVYQRELWVCQHKYDHESGTMYRSFSAFCAADTAQRYSQRALKLAQPQRR